MFWNLVTKALFTVKKSTFFIGVIDNQFIKSKIVSFFLLTFTV